MFSIIYEKIFCKHVTNVSIQTEEVMVYSFALYPRPYQPEYGKKYFYPYNTTETTTTTVTFSDFTIAEIKNNRLVRFYLSHNRRKSLTSANLLNKFGH